MYFLLKFYPRPWIFSSCEEVEGCRIKRIGGVLSLKFGCSTYYVDDPGQLDSLKLTFMRIMESSPWCIDTCFQLRVATITDKIDC